MTKVTDQKKRLFQIHDMGNLIHALGLFFEARALNQETLTLEELNWALDQMRTLKAMHGEIKGSELGLGPLCSLNKAMEILGAYQRYFLPQDKVMVQLVCDEHRLKEQGSRLGLSRGPYERLILNLLKNISEAKATDVDIHVRFKDHVLLLKVTNNALPKASGLGLGLESMRELCEQMGGKFVFKTDFENPVHFETEITIPLKAFETKSFPLAA